MTSLSPHSLDRLHRHVVALRDALLLCWPDVPASQWLQWTQPFLPLTDEHTSAANEPIADTLAQGVVFGLWLAYVEVKTGEGDGSDEIRQIRDGVQTPPGSLRDPPSPQAAEGGDRTSLRSSILPIASREWPLRRRAGRGGRSPIPTGVGVGFASERATPTNFDDLVAGQPHPLPASLLPAIDALWKAWRQEPRLTALHKTLDRLLTELYEDTAHERKRLAEEGGAAGSEAASSLLLRGYEAWLAMQDTATREARGVFYTPAPLVSYSVRAVGQLLQRELGMGWSDDAVVALDPACGTGVFLGAVVEAMCDDARRRQPPQEWASFAGQSLPRKMHGAELLPVPALLAKAHLTARVQRWSQGCPATSSCVDATEWNVVCGNTLDDDISASLRALREEVPVSVVIGNPPYLRHSTNKSAWIDRLLRGQRPDGTRGASYYEGDGAPLAERNLKALQDDYVKFLRVAQWWIERRGWGVVALVCNSGFLDNPTCRGLRQAWMDTFDAIYLLDLHGNARRHRHAPDGSPDANVFGILQGVVIVLAVRRKEPLPTPATVHYAERWGTREEKFAFLRDNDLESTPWQRLAPHTPYYWWVPHPTEGWDEYKEGAPVPSIFPVHSVGIATARDRLTIQPSPEAVWETVTTFASLPEAEARQRFRLGRDVRDWKVAWAQEDIRRSGPERRHVRPILYRPFDVRHTCYTGTTRGFLCMPRAQVMHHLLAGPNLALVTSRMTKGETFHHALVTRHLVEVICLSSRTSNNGFVFPLYLYPTATPDKDDRLAALPWPPGEGGRKPNLAPDWVRLWEEALQRTFVSEGWGDGAGTVGPEALLAYVVAVLHSPVYRQRFCAFLRRDFPRIPLVPAATFDRMAALGQRLIALHLLEDVEPSPVFGWSGPGANLVARGYPRYEPLEETPTSEHTKETPNPLAAQRGRIWINREQHWSGVSPALWTFQVGGYTVCEKWLKGRRGQHLSAQDIHHVQRMLTALDEMQKVQAALEQSEGEETLV